MSLLDPNDLAALDAPHLVCIDARSGPAGRAAYAEGHLPGAIHVDLERDLAAPPRPDGRGGRHPLPDPIAWAALLGRLGIGPESTVIVYDDQGGANAAARFWWMLRASGHANVRVLDGGGPAAKAAGVRWVPDDPTPTSRPLYPIKSMDRFIASLEDVERASHDSGSVLLDVRSPERHRGEIEPIDPIAGHLPGARNVPFASNLDARGRFRSPEELRALYAPLLAKAPPERWIVHCGSGVTACHTLLALEHAGLPGARLYVGSFSEYCRLHPDRIVKGA